MPVSFRAAAAFLLLASTASFAVAEPPPPPRRPAPERWGDARLAAAYIGHATVLLRLGRTHVLIDPAFFERVGIAVGG
jgi:hypothetical protein